MECDLGFVANRLNVSRSSAVIRNGRYRYEDGTYMVDKVLQLFTKAIANIVDT
ncbi:hypothetical protein [Roseibium sp.]|uniref:hypothetical protein n=1 Tax=Roseibium sp. TaxID=1936156 RepID=UPI003D0F7B3D